jgi:hypothetical protein
MKPVHPTTFHITRREELVAAIKQRSAPIVIENEELGRPFERYRRMLRWWIVEPIAASRIMRSAFPEIRVQAGGVTRGIIDKPTSKTPIRAADL